MQDLNDMLYFAEVVDRGGFAAAGRALGIPKSRLSRRVAELEERLLRIQGHFEDQMQSRDQRIVELEREIRAREEMIRRLFLARTGQTEL